MPKLTPAAVLKSKPTKARREIPDTGSGLYLIIQTSGTKSWAMRFRNPHGKRKKLTLGPLDLSGRKVTDDVPAIGQPLDLLAARRLAAHVNTQRAHGHDVVANFKRAKLERAAGLSHVFDGAALNFVEHYLKRKVRRWQAAARLIGIAPDSEGQLQITPKGLADRWRDKPLSSITADDIHWVIDEARERAVPGLKRSGRGPSESMAHQMSSVLRRMFAWLLEKRLVKTNLFADVVAPKAKGNSRERFLSDREIARFWNATDKLDAPAGQCLKLLLLTGARLNEIAMLSRAEIDGATITIPSARSKNKLAHVVPLPPLALDILNSVTTSTDLYFTGKSGKPLGPWSRIKVALDKHMQPDAPFVVHDLRRTVSTGMNALGIAPATVEAVLNHVSGHKAGVAGTYNRHTYLPEKTAALARWADHVTGLIESRTAKIVPMKRAARSKAS
jgi:integrase